MTDIFELAPPEGPDEGPPARTATLSLPAPWAPVSAAEPGPASPADWPWVIPSPSSGAGGGGGGWVDERTGEGPGSTPPPPRATRTGARWIVWLLLAAVAGFLITGRISLTDNGSSPASPSVLRPAAPANPYFGNGSSSTPGPVGGSSSLSATDLSTIAAKVNAGVVDINTTLGYQNGEAAGTGMVLTSSGQVLTNNHVVDGATEITATVVDTGRRYTAHVVGTDPTDDVAVLQLEGAPGLKTITAAKSAVAVGDSVVATGNAGGAGGTPSVVTGTVVALGQTITVSDQGGGNAETLNDLIQVDAPIEAGDSGGPLANKSGEVIGMDTAAEVSGPRFRSTSTAGFAIPIAKALSIAQQIESGKASSTIHIGLPAFLGVEIAQPGSRSRVPSTTTSGALITGILPGTPAASAGLVAGDTITSVDGQSVDSPPALTPLLQTHRPGDQVTIGWTDQSGTHHSARATLIAGPAD